MTDKHLPELGQWAFSNGQFHPHPVPELMHAAFNHLGREIERIEWNRRQAEYTSPFSHYGGEWSCEVFQVRPYCWCDGERAGHEHGCPPNFEFGDLKINWYKHCGRSMSSSEELTPDRIAEVLETCLAAVRALDTAAIMRESGCTSDEAATRSKEIQ